MLKNMFLVLGDTLSFTLNYEGSGASIMNYEL